MCCETIYGIHYMELKVRSSTMFSNLSRFRESITWSWKAFSPTTYIMSLGSRESITWSWKTCCNLMMPFWHSYLGIHYMELKGYKYADIPLAPLPIESITWSWKFSLKLLDQILWWQVNPLHGVESLIQRIRSMSTCWKNPLYGVESTYIPPPEL